LTLDSRIDRSTQAGGSRGVLTSWRSQALRRKAADLRTFRRCCRRQDSTRRLTVKDATKIKSANHHAHEQLIVDRLGPDELVTLEAFRDALEGFDPRYAQLDNFRRWQIGTRKAAELRLLAREIHPLLVNEAWGQVVVPKYEGATIPTSWMQPNTAALASSGTCKGVGVVE
jgi:hypothetical protein